MAATAFTREDTQEAGDLSEGKRKEAPAEYSQASDDPPTLSRLSRESRHRDTGERSTCKFFTVVLFSRLYTAVHEQELATRPTRGEVP